MPFISPVLSLWVWQFAKLMVFCSQGSESDLGCFVACFIEDKNGYSFMDIDFASCHDSTSRGN